MDEGLSLNCPLCGSYENELFHQDKVRRYYCCRFCRLIFVPEKFHLDLEAERAEYDLHQNNPEDDGYRRFLSRLTDPLIERLPLTSSGLDFGCGPGPALSAMLTEAGHTMVCYDPHYFPDYSLLESRYDFICATEVVEHLRQPSIEFERLFRIVNPGGWLAIMTKMVKNRNAFRDWHYIRDLTHICFFHQDTFVYLADHFQAEPVFIGSDVVLLRKT